MWVWSSIKTVYQLSAGYVFWYITGRCHNRTTLRIIVHRVISRLSCNLKTFSIWKSKLWLRNSVGTLHAFVPRHSRPLRSPMFFTMLTKFHHGLRVPYPEPLQSSPNLYVWDPFLYSTFRLYIGLPHRFLTLGFIMVMVVAGNYYANHFLCF